MILMNFGLFWSGAPLSYLRYLTFKTLRYFHPRSRIQLFISRKYKKCEDKSGLPNQEFINPAMIKKDYLPMLSALNVEVEKLNIFPESYPFQQADMYRWTWLRHNGGIYLDPDQIILRPFDSLPLKKYGFMYSSYKVKSQFALNGEFSPIGVLGAERNNHIVNEVLSRIQKYKATNNYNAIGVLMMHDIIKKIDMKNSFNAPPNYFYPAPICDYMDGIYNGKLTLPKESLSAHWFGGYGPSIDFNRKYTEEFAKISNDTISRFLREHKII